MDAEEEGLSATTGSEADRSAASSRGRESDPWRRRSHRLLHTFAAHAVRAVDLHPSAVQLVGGVRFAETFVPTESWRAPNSEYAARDQLLHSIAGRAVNVSVPESLVIRRMFHLPTKDEREIEAILGYQLAPSLPIDLRDLHWSWWIVESSEIGSRVLVELVRKDALEQHLAPLTDVGARVDRAVPEGWILAQRLQLLTDRSESTGLFLRPDGVMLVVQREGRFLHSTRLLAQPLGAADLDGPLRRNIQQKLEAALERARQEFVFHFDRELPPVAIVVADPALSPRDHEIEVVVSNALGAEPAGARVHEEALPWRGLALAALTSEPGPSLVPGTSLHHERRRRLQVHAALLALAIVAALATLGRLDLERLERANTALQTRLAAEASARTDLSAMQEALAQAASKNAGGVESLRVLLTVQRHATSDFLLERLSYVAGQKVQISGSAQDVSSVIAFAQKLERDPLFASTTVQALHEVVREERTRTRFEIEGRMLP